MLSIRQNQNGLSVVELLITLIVMGVSFGAFITTFLTIQNINKKTIDINRANAIAFEKMQYYENTSFSSLPATTPTGTLVQVEDFSSSLPGSFESPRVGRVYINTVSPTLKHVVVSVEFGSGDGKRIMQYANFIQQNGLGR
jgi:hypothetical protein